MRNDVGNMQPVKMTKARKADHLKSCLEEAVERRENSNGFDRYSFTHQSLPEMDINEVDLSIKLFNKRLKAPLLISPMTGGTSQAAKINNNLALAAQELGIAMGVGSQRVALEQPEVAYSFKVRDIAPDILLFANLGAVQLNYGYSVYECISAVEMIEANGLILHLNPVQEFLQEEGDMDFSNLVLKIEEVCALMPYPVIIKEVGYGISSQVAAKLKKIGISGIDVAGLGGTCWTAVEKHRLPEAKRRFADTFSDWGIPTAESLRMVKAEVQDELTVISSGGIRTGLDIAKSIALGADLVGIAGPLLRLAAESVRAVVQGLGQLIEELKATMFFTGAANIEQLKCTPLSHVRE